MPKKAQKSSKKKATKKKGLEGALEELNKDYGPNTVMKMDAEIVPADVIPTTMTSLDDAVGVGGFPRGRISELYGEEQAGKTTLALKVIAEAQRMGLKCAYIDAEHALIPRWAETLGVDLKDLYLSQPSWGEQALEIVDKLVRSGEMGLIIVDSVAALVPKKELEGEMGDANVGLHPRMMSQAMRKLTAIVAQSNTCVIFINQIRIKIGVMFGSPKFTPGGRALKFYSALRIELQRIKTLVSEKGGVKRKVGSRIRAVIRKNKLAPPFKEAEFELIFDKGLRNHG